MGAGGSGLMLELVCRGCGAVDDFKDVVVVGLTSSISSARNISSVMSLFQASDDSRATGLGGIGTVGCFGMGLLTGGFAASLLRRRR